MNARTVCFTKILRIGMMLSVLFLAASYTSTADAAQGCGYGRHVSVYGRCVGNFPGPYATPAPYHRGCWRNAWGQLRCY